MQTVLEMLYDYWVASPNPDQWPEHLQDNPVRGQGIYAFRKGLRLGMLLATDALYPEAEPFP